MYFDLGYFPDDYFGGEYFGHEPATGSHSYTGSGGCEAGGSASTSGPTRRNIFGGSVRPPEPKPARHHYTYVASGGGIAGGTAKTRFSRAPITEDEVLQILLMAAI